MFTFASLLSFSARLLSFLFPSLRLPHNRLLPASQGPCGSHGRKTGRLSAATPEGPVPPPHTHTLVHEMHAKCVVTTRRGAESISAVPRGAPIEGKAWGQGGDNKQNKTHKHEDNRPRNWAPIAPSPKHMPSARHLRSRPLSLGGYHAPTKGDRRYDLHDLWQRGEVSEFRYHV